MIFQPIRAVEPILKEVFENFNFHDEPGLLQFWTFNRDPGCNLILTDITCNPTQDQGLEDIADQKTTHHVVDQHDQYSDDVGDRGQLVLPVFFDDGAGFKPVGIIEYVTIVRKESYVKDFEQFHNLLKDEGLESTYKGKTIKVVYNRSLIRFTLPLSAKFIDLYTEVVTNRFKELQNQIFRVEYNNTAGNRLVISSDDDLQICLAESSSRGSKFIRMFVFVEQIRGEATKGLIRESYGIANTELIHIQA